MTNLKTIEIKAYVPAKDFELSKQFYQDLGFTLCWSEEDLAKFEIGTTRFLLQNFYTREHAENFMMHMLVENADDWWQHIQKNKLMEKYGVKAAPPEDRHWGIRDLVLDDPSGVLWRIGHEINE